MRHLKSINHLGRKSAHRKAMLANMASSLIMNKRIATTEAKAKALRTYVEPLITKSKDDSTHNRRVVFSYLKNKVAVAELFRDVSPAIADRPGGYTRILKTGNRLGDNADMCIIELVDFNENMLEAAAAEAKEKTGRRRRGAKKKDDVTADAKSDTRSAAPVMPDTVEDVVTTDLESDVSDEAAETEIVDSKVEESGAVTSETTQEESAPEQESTEEEEK